MAQRAAQKATARQEKLAALRAEQDRKRRVRLLSIGAIGAVLVVVVVLVAVKVVSGSSNSTAATGNGSSSASSQVVRDVTSVPSGVLDTVGKGTLRAPPAAISGNHSLTAQGKPRVLYAGAEYCPYCAAERWSMVVALSRFGTFQQLGQTASSSSDVYPSTPTLSFHGSSYSSKYLSFTGYETLSNKRQGNTYAPLDKMPAADQKIVDTFDAAPYVPSDTAGSIPFVDLGGRYLISGASYDPSVLAGMTHAQIAHALGDASTPVAKAVDGTANVVTAALCRLTGDKPAVVCHSRGVTTAAGALPGA